jgi:hypothetical protein
MIFCHGKHVQNYFLCGKMKKSAQNCKSYPKKCTAKYGFTNNKIVQDEAKTYV